MENQFLAEHFFDLSNFPFAQLFDKDQPVWTVIPKIGEFILARFQDGTVKGNYKNESVYIGEGTVIEEGAYIKGPAIIGKNCVIRHGAYIRENVIFADNVTAHHGVEIKQSIIFSNSFIPHVGYVGDSVVGRDVNIAGGVKLANFRFDKKEVTVRVGNEKISTGLQKFGSIIGDGCQLGANSVLNPGTVLGKRTIVYPLTLVSGFHAGDEVLR